MSLRGGPKIPLKYWAFAKSWFFWVWSWSGPSSNPCQGRSLKSSINHFFPALRASHRIIMSSFGFYNIETRWKQKKKKKRKRKRKRKKNKQFMNPAICWISNPSRVVFDEPVRERMKVSYYYFSFFFFLFSFRFNYFFVSFSPFHLFIERIAESLGHYRFSGCSQL